MQSLRIMHAVRGVMRPGCQLLPKTVVMQEARKVLLLRFYGEEGSRRKWGHKSKEERRALIISFVEKYKVLHEGKFPGASLVREEVGGAYNTVKEILQDLLKMQSSNTREESDVLETSTIEAALKMEKDESAGVVLNEVDADGEFVLASSETYGSQTTDLKGLNLSAADSYSTALKTEKNENVGGVVNEVDAAGKLFLVASETSNSQMTDLKGRNMSLTDSYSRPRDEDYINELFKEQNKGVAEEQPNKTHPIEKNEANPPKFSTSDSQYLQKRLPQEERAQVKGLKSEELLKFFSKFGSQQNTQALEDSDEESENDPDFSAPEYSVTDGIKKIRAALSSSRESALNLKHELYINYVPLSATHADLRKAFKDCGEIVNAQVFPALQKGAHFTYGFLHFKTEEGLNAARMKDKVFIKNVEVKIKGSFAKELQMIKNSTPGFSSQAKTENSGNSESSSQRGASLPLSVPHSLQNSHAEKVKTPSSMILPKGHVSQMPKSTGGFKVILQNIPSKIDASEVREVMSENGEVIAAEEKSGSDSTMSHVIHFKTKAAQRAALACKPLLSNGKFYQVKQIGDLETTVVRVSNLPSDWTENEIRLICRNMGDVVTMESRGREIVDIFFDSKETTIMNRILLSLNTSTLRGKLLQASLAPRFLTNAQHVASALGDKQLSKPLERKSMFNAEVILQEISELETCVQELKRSFHDIRELIDLKIQQLYSCSVNPK